MQGLLASEFGPFTVVNVDSLTVHLTPNTKEKRPACKSGWPMQNQFVWGEKLLDPTYFRGRDLSGATLCEKCQKMRDGPGINLGFY